MTLPRAETIEREIQEVRESLKAWAARKSDIVQYRAKIINGNLKLAVRNPSRELLEQTKKNVADLARMAR